MHSLVRFMGNETKMDDLARLGQALNQIVPGTFTRFDDVPGQFSCSLCSSDHCDDHRSSVLDFIQKYPDVLVQAKALDVVVVFDMIVHPEDRAGSIYTSFVIDREMIAALVHFGGEIAFSVCDYPPD